MATLRLAVRAPLERARPAAAVSIAVRSPAAISPAALQRRFGNQGSGAVIRAVAERLPVPVPPPRAPERGTVPQSSAERAAEPAAPAPSAATAAAPAGGAAPPPVAGAPPMAAAAAPVADRPAAAPAAASAPGETRAPPPEKAAAGPVGSAPAAAVESEAPPPSPAEAVAPVAAQVRRRAGKARVHAPKERAAAAAQAAAIVPATQQRREAARGTVEAIDRAETKQLNRESFRDKLREALARAVPEPKTPEHAEELKQQGADRASAALSSQLSAETGEASGQLDAAVQPGAEIPASAIAPPPESDLVPEVAGPAPAPVGAAAAVPEPTAPPDFSQDRAPTDRAMAEADVTKEQMARSNEPDFTATLKAREDAEQQEAERTRQFTAGEGAILARQRGATGAMLGRGLEAMHGTRAGSLGAVAAKQGATRTAEAAERDRITLHIERIKNATRQAVLAQLQDMETTATKFFQAGLERAEKAYEAVFDEEKGGLWEWATNWGDDWEEHIAAAFSKARAEYNRIVSETIDLVAEIVEGRLARTKLRVSEGRREVDDYVAGLDSSVRRFGEEARTNIGAAFDEMEGEIDSRRDAIVEKLADQYRESQKRVAALEEKLKEANKSLWQRIYDATVGIIKKIIAFKDFLLGVLAKAAKVIGAIIRDPIGFLGNLIDGVMAGLNGFMSRIGTHLKKGLLEWLFGALEGAGLKLPEKFDLKGIVDLVLQVLGLTWVNIRARAVRILGAETVGYLEKTWEIFVLLVREGPGALWKMLIEKIGDIKEMILAQIGAWVEEKIIFAGIKWVLSLLNPVAAFIKACMAIYDIVKFFIERATQIAQLINAVVESLGAIVGGNISTMAKAIEEALARMVPVAIGFLASLLNLGGISEKIRAVIAKLRAPVDAAIEWIIGKAVDLAKKAGAFVKGKAQAVASWLGFRRKVTFASGATHTLSIAGSEARPVLMMASNADPVEVHLQNATTDAGLNEKARKAAGDALAFHQGTIMPLLGQPLPAGSDKNVGPLPQALDAFSVKLVAVSAAAMDGQAVPETKARQRFQGPRHSSIEELSNKESTKGADTSSSSGNPTGWALLQTKGLTDKEWVRMHMISAGFGGTAVATNVIPAPKSVNSGARVRNFETTIEEILYGGANAGEVRSAQKEAEEKGKVSPFAAALAKRPSVIWVKCETSADYPEELDPVTKVVICPAKTFVTDVTLTAGLHYFDVGAKKWQKDERIVASAADTVPKPNLTGAAQPWWELGPTRLSAATGFTPYFAGILLEWANTSGKTTAKKKADLDKAYKAGQLTLHSDEAIELLDKAVSANKVTF